MRSIGNKSIFGEYLMDENRVTAALLHIIRLCGVELVNDLNIDKQPHTIFKLGSCVRICHTLDGNQYANVRAA